MKVFNCPLGYPDIYGVVHSGHFPHHSYGLCLQRKSAVATMAKLIDAMVHVADLGPSVLAKQLSPKLVAASIDDILLTQTVCRVRFVSIADEKPHLIRINWKYPAVPTYMLRRSLVDFADEARVLLVSNAFSKMPDQFGVGE